MLDKLLKLRYNINAGRWGRRRHAQKAKRPRLPSALIAIFKRGFPDAFAILGSPSQVPAGSLEVLGGGLCGGLGLGVLDFVKVHFLYPLSFCAFIISQGMQFVKCFNKKKSGEFLPRFLFICTIRAGQPCEVSIRRCFADS